MKKFTYILIILALAGTALTAYMTLSHYYPDRYGMIACGDGFISSCLSLQISRYSRLFGIPLAAYGLFYYLLVLFTLLVADYAEDRYHLQAAALLFPVTVLAVAGDLVLAVLLICIRQSCVMCFMSYAINILLLAVLGLFLTRLKKMHGIGWMEVFKSPFNASGSDRKAVLSLYTIFVFLLAYTVFSTSYILAVKTQSPEIPRERIDAFLKEFYAAPVEKFSLPESGLILGKPSARVKIIAFTDFLCSACYEFYKVEKYSFAKYGEKISVHYYNYPLEKTCNRYAFGTRYENSCVASRAMLTAARKGQFAAFLQAHFRNYDRFHGQYGLNSVKELLVDLPGGRGDFLETMNKEDLLNLIRRDTDLAQKLKIEATPTLFINGRRMVGVPSQEEFDSVIDRELSRSGR